MIWKGVYDAESSTWFAPGRIVYVEIASEDPEDARAALLVQAAERYPAMTITWRTVETSSAQARDSWLELHRKQQAWMEAARTASAKRGML